LKSSARQTAVEAELTLGDNTVAGADAARRRLDDAIARLEKEVVARIAQVRAEAKAELGGRLSGLELEVAKLKAEKRDLERTVADLRKAADGAAAAIDHAMSSVQSVLDETVGNA
jgi:hypothetical protein